MMTTIRKSLLAMALTLGGGAATAGDLYTVARGDTLYGIAKTHNISVKELQHLNSLRSPRIVPGQKLRLPGSGASPTVDQSYTVRRGDTLGRIAAAHKIPVTALKQNNRLRSDIIHPGQILFLPSGGRAVTAGLQNQQAASVHVVRSGDTLWDISRKYRISMTTLSSFNDLAKGSTLVPGQRIRIPASGTLNPGGTSDGYSGYAANGAKHPFLESQSVIVVDAQTGKTLLEKNSGRITPIASITKLMTAMVTLDAKLPLDEVLTIDRNDVDHIKMTSSRLPLGTQLTRERMLHLSLMSSENRAASALARHYPGGLKGFLAAMNAKAKVLGMENTYFADSSGLNPKNVSSAADLAKMLAAASSYDLINKYTTDTEELVKTNKTGTLQYRNTNALVRGRNLPIDVSKTGYIREAGRCLVMQAKVGNRPAYMVFLKSNSRAAPAQDALRVKKWLESGASGINLAGL